MINGQRRGKPHLRTHSYPGSIARWAKIALLEGKGLPIEWFPWQILTRKLGKGYKRDVRLAEKAVVRRRVRREIEAQLND